MDAPSNAVAGLHQLIDDVGAEEAVDSGNLNTILVNTGTRGTEIGY